MGWRPEPVGRSRDSRPAPSSPSSKRGGAWPRLPGSAHASTPAPRAGGSSQWRGYFPWGERGTPSHRDERGEASTLTVSAIDVLLFLCITLCIIAWIGGFALAVTILF